MALARRNNPIKTDVIQVLQNEDIVKDSDRDGSGENAWFAQRKHAHELTHSALLLTSLSNNIAARKKFAWAIYCLVCFWLASVVAIVVLTGFKYLTLESSVLITLIGSGSVNVVGLFSIVAHYLFQVHSAKDSTSAIKTSADLDRAETGSVNSLSSSASGDQDVVKSKEADNSTDAVVMPQDTNNTQ